MQSQNLADHLPAALRQGFELFDRNQLSMS